MAKFYVKDKYRTNKLSLKPGGHKVCVKFENGDELTYDKVKYPRLYVKSLTGDNKRGKIVKVTVDGELFGNY